MKIKCIEDVVIDAINKKAFTKGKIYNAYYYRGQFSMTPFKKTFCAKNDFGKRHCIKNPDNPKLDEFFNKHFEVVATEVPK